MKNLKAYEVFLVISILLKWIFSFVVDNMSPAEQFKNLELLANTAAILSFFFYTMIILTIQALVHNVSVIQYKVYGEDTPINKRETEEEKRARHNFITFIIVVMGIFAAIIWFL